MNGYPTFEYRWEDLDPGFVTWFALAHDVYAEDREAGIGMLADQLARVMVRAATTPGPIDVERWLAVDGLVQVHAHG